MVFKVKSVDLGKRWRHSTNNVYETKEGKSGEFGVTHQTASL